MNLIQPDTTLPKTPSIKTYTALLSQTGTSAPVATVLQNTLGATLTWARTGVGFYTATTTEGIFPVEKTTVSLTCATGAIMITGGNNEIGTPSTQIYVRTTAYDGTQTDDALYISYIQIQIHQ